MVKADEPVEHATTRYQQITEAVVDELQRTSVTGGDLYKVAPWISHENKRIIVAETLDADRAVALPVRTLLVGDDDEVGPLTDYKCAVMAERLMHPSGAGSQATRDARVNELLTLAGRSSTASPLLAYESLYRDLAESALLDGDRSALDWLMRALAHNRRFHKSDDLAFQLIDIASARLQLGDLDEGLSLLAHLIHQDPANQWTYRFIATGLGTLGLADLGLKGTRRGLQLLDERGDPEDLRDEFLMAEFDVRASEKRGREADVSSDVMAELEAALATDFSASDEGPAGQSLDVLVPGLDEVPVKRPMRFTDVPEMVRDRMARACR